MISAVLLVLKETAAAAGLLSVPEAESAGFLSHAVKANAEAHSVASSNFLIYSNPSLFKILMNLTVIYTNSKSYMLNLEHKMQNAQF